MARPLRLDFPGAIHHVTSRRIGICGGRSERLFHDQRDYVRFIERLEEGVADFGVRIYMFCLMASHFHLVVETPKANLSRFMQRLSTAYTVYYNLRHRRHGHVLDGRFKAKVVAGDEYLLRLTRYVHLNPVRSGGWEKRPIGERIKHLNEYRWSSYPGYVGNAPSHVFLSEGPVLAMMGGGRSRRRRDYRQYVESGLATSDEELREAMRASTCAVGDDRFRAWVEGLRSKALGERKGREDVAFRRVVNPLAAAIVIAQTAKRFGVEESVLGERHRNPTLRAVAARYLIRYAGQTQREVAADLGIGTGAAVSAQLKRLRKKEEKDRVLRSRLARLAQDLEAMQSSGGTGSCR